MCDLPEELLSGLGGEQEMQTEVKEVVEVEADGKEEEVTEEIEDIEALESQLDALETSEGQLEVEEEEQEKEKGEEVEEQEKGEEVEEQESSGVAPGTVGRWQEVQEGDSSWDSESSQVGRRCRGREEGGAGKGGGPAIAGGVTLVT